MLNTLEGIRLELASKIDQIGVMGIGVEHAKREV